MSKATRTTTVRRHSAPALCSCCQDRIRRLERLLLDARAQLQFAKESRQAAVPRPAEEGWLAARLKAAFPDLTEREHEVLGLYMECVNHKVVSRRLRTSIHTVRNQIASIEHKVGAGSREELVKVVLMRTLGAA